MRSPLAAMRRLRHVDLVTVTYAILAALRDEPKHGYAIRQSIQEMLGLLWPVNQGQLYSTLARLATRGWIAPSAPDEGGTAAASAARRRYELRPPGERRLEEWLARPTGFSTAPGELHQKLHVAAALGGERRLLRLVARQREALLALATTCRSHAHRTRTGDAAGPAALLRAAAVDLLEADVDWLSAIERELRAGVRMSAPDSSQGACMATSTRTDGGS